MVRVLINFKDNDYGSVFLGLGKTLFNAFKYHSLEDIKNKHVLAYNINNMLISHYTLFKYGNYMLYKEDEERYYNDLKVSADRIYINEEVDIYLKKRLWNDNLESVVIDLNLFRDNDETVYLI